MDEEGLAEEDEVPDAIELEDVLARVVVERPHEEVVLDGEGGLRRRLLQPDVRELERDLQGVVPDRSARDLARVRDRVPQVDVVKRVGDLGVSGDEVAGHRGRQREEGAGDAGDQRTALLQPDRVHVHPRELGLAGEAVDAAGEAGSRSREDSLLQSAVSVEREGVPADLPDRGRGAQERA